MAINWKMGILLARSQTRERADVACGVSWSEYRLRYLEQQEFYALRQSGKICRQEPYRPFLVEIRRIRTSDVSTEEGPWELWQLGQTVKETVAEGGGDSSYFLASSIHPLHRRAMGYLKLLRETQEHLWRTEQCSHDVLAAIETYRIECEREFTKKTSGKDDKQVKKIKERLLKLRLPRLQDLQADYREAAQKHKQAQQHNKEVRQQKW